ncbi:MAG: Maf family protein [Alphaproteobacteria bacterium]|nr:Maf family protein [Alphaproteobacteria bacterium]
MPEKATEVILASASPSRAALLRAAGIAFRVQPAAVDEEEIKQSLRAEGAPAGDIAVALAELKALRVSRAAGPALVIGADQIMVCDDIQFDKPPDLAAARDQLLALRGQTHALHTALAVASQNVVIWHHIDVARLTMRPFSDRFLDGYLADAGESILDSVGAYRLEGLGIQLFSRIDGEFFTILGLPILPLLAFLRGHRVVEQ